MRFGHSLLGGDTFEVIHFAFEFYEFRTWNLLINPSNPLVQAVQMRILEDEDYFFFAERCPTIRTLHGDANTGRLGRRPAGTRTTVIHWP